MSKVVVTASRLERRKKINKYLKRITLILMILYGNKRKKWLKLSAKVNNNLLNYDKLLLTCRIIVAIIYV